MSKDFNTISVRSFLCLLTCFLFQKALADQPRVIYSFKSPNARFELKPCDTVFSDKKVYTDSTYDSRTNTYYVSSYSYADRYHWSLYDTQTDRKLYTITDDSLAIEMKTAVISNDGQNVVIIDDYPGRLAFKKREMMTFYERGTRLKRIYLGDLIQNFCSLSYSASHMSWCRGYFHFNERREIIIETHEFYRYTYNANGDLLHKKSNKRIQPGDILANGKIESV